MGNNRGRGKGKRTTLERSNSNPISTSVSNASQINGISVEDSIQRSLGLNPFITVNCFPYGSTNNVSNVSVESHPSTSGFGNECRTGIYTRITPTNTITSTTPSATSSSSTIQPNSNEYVISSYNGLNNSNKGSRIVSYRFPSKPIPSIEIVTDAGTNKNVRPLSTVTGDDVTLQQATINVATASKLSQFLKRTATQANLQNSNDFNNSFSSSKVYDSPVDGFTCCLCLERYTDPHITTCGHTYCLNCIQNSISLRPKCPTCSLPLESGDVIPNRIINSLIKIDEENAKKFNNDVIRSAVDVATTTNNVDVLKGLSVHGFIQKKYNQLTLPDVNLLLNMLLRRRDTLVVASDECKEALVTNFLNDLRLNKTAELKKVKEDMHYIEEDICRAQENSEKIKRKKDFDIPEPISGSIAELQSLNFTNDPPEDYSFALTNKSLVGVRPLIPERKKIIHSHFGALSDLYYKWSREIELQTIQCNDETVKTDLKERHFKRLTDTLVNVSNFQSARLLATLNFMNESIISGNIVSTIAFDKDTDYFAIAGITKKIKLFDYNSVIASTVSFQCPTAEFLCSSKISCVTYSKYLKNKLASSDYDGQILIWDTSTCSTVMTLFEHEKRVWSVDFSDSDPRYLVSGSDDCTVKIWSINQKNAGVTINASSFICSVKFQPTDANYIAVGSSDQTAQYYDLRKPNQPVKIFTGHKRSVSYVTFTSPTELVSAATDSSLKMWDLTKLECSHTFNGHLNDKNFVGLTTDGSYLACGSENNSICFYYKYIKEPLFLYKFHNYQSLLSQPIPEETSNEFVSAVAWKTGSPVIIAANSQGIIKVLELI